MKLYKLTEQAKRGLEPDNFYWNKAMILAKWKKIGYKIGDLIQLK